MLLCSGTIVSNMSRASSSMKEVGNEGESVPPSQAIKLVQALVNTSEVSNPPNNTNVNHISSFWTMFNLPPWIVGLFPNMYNNPIYQNHYQNP